MADIQAIILAGGEGTRLRPLTRNRPKVMLPVANHPILEHVLNAVVEAGVRDITVVVGYQKQQVMNFLNGYPIPIKVVVQEKQLGSYHALSCAKECIHARTIVLAGDNYVDAESIRTLLEEKNALLVAPHEKPWEYGVIIQQNGCLKGVNHAAERVEPGALVSCATYVGEKEMYDCYLSEHGSERLMDRMKSGDEVVSVVVAHDWQDASNPADLIALNRSLLQKQKKTSIGGIIDKGAKIRGSVIIGANTKVGAGAVITGPVVIGDNCVIGPNVCISEGTSIGSRVRIEPFTYVKNSIIMADCIIDAQSKITDSVIGEGCVIQQTATATRDFGAVIGDRASIGAFTILRGAIIGNNVTVDGGRLIECEIPDNARVI